MTFQTPRGHDRWDIEVNHIHQEFSMYITQLWFII